MEQRFTSVGGAQRSAKAYGIVDKRKQFLLRNGIPSDDDIGFD